MYFLSENDWSSYGCTYYYSYDIDPLYGAYGNGYIPYIAVIGGGYELHVTGNDVPTTAQLDAAIASLGLFANFEANIQNGPANLGVKFTSTASGSPDTWEWDLDGDGEIDSTEENPYFLYTSVGTYDVTLTIWQDDESNTLTQEDFVTVTDGTNISGQLSGVWDAAHSPYVITGDVKIPEGNQLDIEAGTIVQTNNDSEFRVEGKLVADASGRSPITFTSNDTWKGIKFLDTNEENVINNCHITKATLCAIEADNSTVTVTNSRIYENTTDTQKSTAINLIDCDEVVIEECMIANNESTSFWGGIGCHNADPLINHNIVVNNTAGYAGAFHFTDDSEPELINNTVANNEAGFAAMWFASCSPTITNCIVIDSEDPFANFGGSPTVTYSCLSGGYSGTGNIDADPHFADPSDGDGAAFDGLNADWNLTSDSPCIDAGDPNSPQDPDGTRADMGALYYNQFGIDDPQTQPVVQLLQNHPNPVRESTTFNYHIVKGEDQPVEIEIYNVQGRLVDYVTGNDGKAVWNPKDIQSGIYFYRLSNSDKTASKKLLIIK
ncbi:MAG: T9SS type A sorting domain-containing protein [Candidatus Cloacimonetes bacterium]|nr:T9SS type A sorting domain-containing protein [Candidatus Cloacimonadota bacterium]MBS3768408.1 T9SS type A sorting domain-containing protein [Candidatus Cloacimonadota bacterium]